MDNFLSQLVEQFSPEEQAAIKAGEARAQVILLQGGRELKERFRRVVTFSHYESNVHYVKEPQDEAQASAAAAEFCAYHKVLSGRVDLTSKESIERFLAQLDRVATDLIWKYGSWESGDAIQELRAHAEQLAWEGHRKALSEGHIKIALTAQANSTSSGSSFPKRAAWLKDEMRKRGAMTAYGLHKQGGPDAKTIRKILDGKPVRDPALDLIVTGLSNAGQQVKRGDIRIIELDAAPERRPDIRIPIFLVFP